MDILINGKHHEPVDITLRQYTLKKLDKISCYNEMISDIHITYSQDHISKIAEARLNITGTTLIAKAECQTSYGAMDSLIDKIKRQLVKQKDKMHATR